MAFGTKVVAGVTPGRGGMDVNGIPVYDTVAGALRRHDAEISVVFVPARAAKSAVIEALVNGIRTVVVITEHIPLHDEFDILATARTFGARIIGPNTPGYAIPRLGFKAGIIPNSILASGNIAVISRSGTLTYEVLSILRSHGMGESFCIGVGGDRVHGTTILDALKMAECDRHTNAVVVIGEIGGTMEDRAAEYIGEMSKPVVAYIAGMSAPPGKRMGHAGAIIGLHGTAREKAEKLEDSGAIVVSRPSEIPDAISRNVDHV